MSFVWFVDHPQLLEPLNKRVHDEWLLGFVGWAKGGRLTPNDWPKLVSSPQRRVLLADRILSDPQLESAIKELTPWVKAGWVQAVRFLDPGLGVVLGKAFPQLPLQADLRFGGVNEKAVNCWAKGFGSGLERLVLSNQIPVKALGLWDKRRLLPFEMQVLGPIEVFYSARPLLGGPWRGAARSEVRPRQSATLLEGPEGTVMYHSRELFILDRLSRLTEVGVNFWRLAPTSAKLAALIVEAIETQDWAGLKAAWPQKTTAGFFSANRTDRPLKRLNNPILFSEDWSPLGRVVSGQKGSHCLIELEQTLILPAPLKLINPEGKSSEFILQELKDLRGKVYKELVPPGLYLSSWIKQGLAQSLLIKG